MPKSSDSDSDSSSSLSSSDEKNKKLSKGSAAAKKSLSKPLQQQKYQDKKEEKKSSRKRSESSSSSDTSNEKVSGTEDLAQPQKGVHLPNVHESYGLTNRLPQNVPKEEKKIEVVPQKLEKKDKGRILDLLC